MTDTHDPRAAARTPDFGHEGEGCDHCGSPMARDQRYCLACGARRTGLGAVLSEPAPRETAVADGPAAPAGPPPEPPALLPPPLPPRFLNAGVAGGVACLLLALLVGVLIGRAGRERAPAVAAAPAVVTVGGTGPAASGEGAAATTPAAFKSDWPDGKRGFTVQLQTLPKGGTDAAAVVAAKQAAVAKGAAGAGALDSDDHATLDPGQYVIFSGQFADRRAAKSALPRLKKAFPDAKVVEVASDSGAARPASTKKSRSTAGRTSQPSKAEQQKGAKAIQDLEKASPKEYQKKSAKLPKTIVTPGKPPPKDSKPAGAGSGSETFK